MQDSKFHECNKFYLAESSRLLSPITVLFSVTCISCFYIIIIHSLSYPVYSCGYLKASSIVVFPSIHLLIVILTLYVLKLFYIKIVFSKILFFVYIFCVFSLEQRNIIKLDVSTRSTCCKVLLLSPQIIKLFKNDSIYYSILH